MISVFEASDYKAYIKSWLSLRPKGGRGESRRIAEKLSVSTTLVSQVINADKHFTMESASDLCDHLGLSERETDHFLLLVDHARAGSHGLRARLKRRLEQSRDAARKLSERVEHDRNLSETQSAIYYSHWVYTGVRNYLATDNQASISQIADRLKVPESLVNRVISFLLETGILISKEGAYDVGVKRTYLGSESPLVVKHHQNWRLQAFNKMPYSDKRDLFLTLPMSLSMEVADRIRDELPSYIEKIGQWVTPSESEVVRCLNIDWFEY